MEAFQAGDYATAIALLEPLGQEPDPEIRVQAQGWLVRAYLKTHQYPQARQVCGVLRQCNRAQIRDWAQQTLAQLPPETEASGSPGTAPTHVAISTSTDSPSSSLGSSPSSGPVDRHSASGSQLNPLTPGDLVSHQRAEELLSVGLKALRKHLYGEAIDALETFLRGTDDTYANHGWARTSLVKAYRGNGQEEAAIALCQQLLQSNQAGTRAWAQDYLKTLAPTPLEPPLPAATVSASTAPDGLAPPLNSITDEARMPSPAFPSTYPSPVRSTTTSPDQGSLRVLPRRDSNDMTPALLSAIAHGSISILGSFLLFLLFPDSLLLNTLSLMRFLVPVVILLVTQDPIVKANAREATNYVLTCLILTVAIALIGWIVVIALFAVVILFWPVIILLGLPLLAYFIALSIWPIVALIQCLQNGGQEARYPNWLILHLA